MFQLGNSGGVLGVTELHPIRIEIHP
jgi:hypothetical protein